MPAEIEGAIRPEPQAVWRAEIYHLILHFIGCCRLQISCCDSSRLCPPYCSQITENDQHKQHHSGCVYSVTEATRFFQYMAKAQTWHICVHHANRLSNWPVRFGFMLHASWPLNDKINLIVGPLIAFLWSLQLPVVWTWPTSVCRPLPWLDSVAEP